MRTILLPKRIVFFLHTRRQKKYKTKQNLDFLWSSVTVLSTRQTQVLAVYSPVAKLPGIHRRHGSCGHVLQLLWAKVKTDLVHGCLRMGLDRHKTVNFFERFAEGFSCLPLRFIDEREVCSIVIKCIAALSPHPVMPQAGSDHRHAHYQAL